jgi:hypothetical protein
MAAPMMKDFCKNEDCPSSHELLEYENGESAGLRSREIRKHLAVCEFCSAEIEFYSHYPQEEGCDAAAEIPRPLFELAEALLKNRHGDSSSLYSLLKEKGEVLADKS